MLARLPLVAAPMAGGPSTVALAQAVAGAGAFPFLAAGYKTAAQMGAEVDALQELGLPFGVNLFVPQEPVISAESYASYAAELQAEAAIYGLSLPPVPKHDDDAWDEKLAVLLRNPAPVVSLTFGLPSLENILALQAVGTKVYATVTTVSEARMACLAGVDALVVQGASAGGHSAAFDQNSSERRVGTGELLGDIAAAVQVPLIAAGGVDGPAAVRGLLEAGAAAVAVGTLLLRTDEAGTNQTYRAALGNQAFTETVVTRAFTGRNARALRNGFVDRHSPSAPAGYPQIHHLTRGLRSAASTAGDTERAHFWAGTGFKEATEGPASEVVKWLVKGL